MILWFNARSIFLVYFCFFLLSGENAKWRILESESDGCILLNTLLHALLRTLCATRIYTLILDNLRTSFYSTEVRSVLPAFVLSYVATGFLPTAILGLVTVNLHGISFGLRSVRAIADLTKMVVSSCKRIQSFVEIPDHAETKKK